MKTYFVVVALVVAVAQAAPLLQPAVEEEMVPSWTDEERATWHERQTAYEASFSYPRSLTNKSNRACPSNPLPPGQTRVTTQHGGVSRQYIVHIPVGYTNTNNLPLVFDVHGWSNNGETQARNSNLREIANRDHFVVVHPEGYGVIQGWNGGDCCGSNQDDLGFFLRMIEEIADRHACVDLRRVYSGGFSNGGFMSHYLGCRTDAFAAIAPVAGTVTLPCPQSTPTPMWHAHGTNDGTIPYNGNNAYESAPTSQSAWASNNDCTPATRVVYQQQQTTCVSRHVCANATGTGGAAESVLCTIEGGTHTFDYTNRGLTTGEESWQFYKRFSRA